MEWVLVFSINMGVSKPPVGTRAAGYFSSKSGCEEVLIDLARSGGYSVTWFLDEPRAYRREKNHAPDTIVCAPVGEYQKDSGKILYPFGGKS